MKRGPKKGDRMILTYNYRYLNARCEEVLIVKSGWSKAMPFRDGRAAVLWKESGKWGYMDEEGMLVIPAVFHHANDFSDGLALVATQPKRKGIVFIDTSGKTVLTPPEEMKISYATFREGFASVSVKSGRALIDHKGKKLNDRDYANCGYFSEGLCAVQPKDEGFHYIDKTGKVIIPGPFKYGRPFKRGFARVEDENRNRFVIDRTGKKIFAVVADSLDGAFGEGLFAKYDAGKKLFGYIDKSGAWIIPAQFRKAHRFSDGLAAVTLLPGKKPKSEGFKALATFKPTIYVWNYIDKQGKVVLKQQGAWANVFDNGVTRVNTADDHTKFIRKDGTIAWTSQTSSPH